MAAVVDRWHLGSGEKSKRYGQGRRWAVRVVDASGKQRWRNFVTKVEADGYAASSRVAKDRGEWIDPRTGKVTVAEYAPVWMATWRAHLKERTEADYGSLLSVHVVPRWGTTPLNRISHGEVATWVGELHASGMSASRVRHCYRTLSLMLDLAVRDQRIGRNPALGVKLPSLPMRDPDKQQALTFDQLHALAEACGFYRALVLLLGYTGIRWGEAAALTVSRVDLEARRIRIVDNLPSRARRITSPKTHQVRTVPIPPMVADALAPLLAGKAGDDRVFTALKGGALDLRVFRRSAFDKARVEIGVPHLRPHDLRHTAVSLAALSGAPYKVVQKMVGHKSATMTLDTYGHLFPDQLDEVMDAMGRAGEEAAARTAAEAECCLSMPGTRVTVPDRYMGDMIV